GGSFGSEHPEETEGVEVEGVGHRQHEEATCLEGDETGRFEVAPSHGEQLRQLRVNAVEERSIHRNSSPVGGRDKRAGSDCTEQPGQDHDDEVIVHLELSRAAGDLALTELAQDLTVDLKEVHRVAEATRERLDACARPHLELLARSGEEQPDVVDKPKGQNN